MRIPRRSLGLVLCSVLAVGCTDPTLPQRHRPAYQLLQKGSSQSLFSFEGIERELQDRNADGVADTIIHFGAKSKPRLKEIDTNFDGVLDRWEHFDRGAYIGATYDTDGDGRPDRTSNDTPPK